jgi:hypothetical protein
MIALRCARWHGVPAKGDRIPGAVSVTWIADVRIKKGENSPFWLSPVEAQFPTDDTDGIIPKSCLLQARDGTKCPPRAIAMMLTRNIGMIWRRVISGGWVWMLGMDKIITLWRFGVDLCFMMYRYIRRWAIAHSAVPECDRMDTVRAAEIAQAVIRRLGGDYRIAVDNTGVGAGTLASLLASVMMNASGCRFGDGADDRSLFFNRKSQLYWEFREGLRTGKVAIAYAFGTAPPIGRASP